MRKFHPARTSLLAIAVAVALVLAGCTGDGSGDDDADGGPTSGSTAPLEIDTTTGTLKGTTTDGVRRFLGVRYAEPPTGPRRWALPQPAADTDEVLDATRPGAQCPQSGSTAQASDEDCLFLNVTTPSKVGDEPWPVMVWWHGGGFTTGSGSEYDAQRLADQGNVAVVTVNYRLGMLGYLGLPGLEGSGNFGLADQLAGVRWAKDNAAAFGGDPDNITVFGESAGGTATCAALTSPEASDLIDKAIFSSGSCRLAWPKGTLFPGLPASRSLIPLAQSEAIGATTAQGLGCRGDSTLACLRRQPVDVLVKQGVSFGNPLAYGTELLPKDPATAIEDGDVAQVPVISGGNRDEHRSFIGGLLLTDPKAVTSKNYDALIRTSFGPDAAAVRRHYPLGDYASAPLAWSTLVTDVAWACTTTRGARDLAAAGDEVFSYEFADRTAPDLNGVESSGLPQGAAHATDLPYYFDLGGKDLLRTPGQHELADTMVELWTSFAHTGTPSAANVDDWPATTSDEAPVLQLGDPQIGLVDHRREHQCGFWESIDQP